MSHRIINQCLIKTLKINELPSHIIELTFVFQRYLFQLLITIEQNLEEQNLYFISKSLLIKLKKLLIQLKKLLIKLKKLLIKLN